MSLQDFTIGNTEESPNFAQTASLSRRATLNSTKDFVLNNLSFIART
jgi:hypothetical protein